jgi:molybdopterin molybdotransferase
MLSFSEAQRAASDAVKILGVTQVPVDSAAGFTLSEDIKSKIDVSPFRNSAMDGYAIHSESLAGCTKENPLTLPVSGAIFAGESDSAEISSSVAVKIMTGAPVPRECDAVVKVEDVQSRDDSVQFFAPAKVGQNIRRPGEDIAKGDTLFRAGDRLGPLDIGVLASIGISEVTAYRKPRVQILVTGDELVEPGVALQHGQIYNSNQRTISSLIQNHCSDVQAGQIIVDNLEQLTRALESDTDVIITSGGVSAGDKDFVPEAAEAAGWKTVFHKCAVKPGKPIYFARRGDQCLFGLPGNPLSVAVTCAVFVIPALKKMAGRSDYEITPARAELQRTPPRKTKRTLIWPGKIWRDGAKTCAAFSEKTSSAALSALLQSDGLIMQSSENELSDSSGQVLAIRWRDLLH